MSIDNYSQIDKIHHIYLRALLNNAIPYELRLQFETSYIKKGFSREDNCVKLHFISDMSAIQRFPTMINQRESDKVTNLFIDDLATTIMLI